MAPCRERQTSSCQELSPEEHPIATETHNEISCLITETPIIHPNGSQDRNFVILFSLLNNKNVSSARTYLQPSDQIEVFLEKSTTEYDKSNHGDSYWVKPVYITNRCARRNTERASDFVSCRADLLSTNISIHFESFNIKHWIRYDSFTGWNAIAEMGGLILFIYVVHCLIMAAVSIFWSPAETITFSSAGQFSTV